MDCVCCSHVGKQIYGGQNVSLGNGCYFEEVLHELLGHVIGFGHEHSRPDRDDYVEIRSENIQDSKDHNFDKLTDETVDSLGEAYDYDSIMHYPNKLYKCPECGGTLIGQQGTFASPNYHTKSGTPFRYEWRISTQIRLSITDMDIFESLDCQSNYFEIRDGYGHESPLLGLFCGTNMNISAIISTGNRIVINYFSNGPENRGFAANYVSYSSVCSGDLTIHNRGKIKSPNYPSYSVCCIWLL
ncbi:bone morphogenetic protein 1-like [Sitodiplosis mosellana]|uniref:bone morphogenetic protein 1-like n=1 Tax=Sitodiplosis mosellana TaxID=263140 RepID=UPI0024442BF7|nr:bone morphogenetic protein 1-like [Sitodiplosis mosellana]